MSEADFRFFVRNAENLLQINGHDSVKMQANERGCMKLSNDAHTMLMTATCEVSQQTEIKILYEKG